MATDPDLGQNATLYAEDIVIPSTGYVVGGITLTVTKAIAVTNVVSVTLKGVSGTTANLNYSLAPVVGSESGQTFKVRGYETGSAVSTGFAELAASSSVLEGLTATVLYKGVP